MNTINTILGAGGSIGNALTYVLLDNAQKVRLVSRSKIEIEGTESFKADIMDFQQTLEAVQNSDVVYLVAGLKYDYNVWKEAWPKIINNVIEACKKSKSKLIFLDNVYMYGKVNGKMTELTPYNPCSKKGEIRAKIATQLENEFNRGNVQGIIARAADFYGPFATKSSVPFVLAVENMLKGKKAKWLLDANIKHSYLYIIDCANGLYLLSNHDEAVNQIWHLPTKNPGITGKNFIELIAKELGVEPHYTIIKKWMVKVGGLLDSTLKELYEMLYQYEIEYYFDSSKFEKHFNFVPTSYENGIKEMIKSLRKVVENKN
jgi:nucleoside-diphosphate-sugar epimerase